MFVVAGIDFEDELQALKFENAKLKREIAALRKAASDRSWHDDYIRDTYIIPNWKADGQW